RGQRCHRHARRPHERAGDRQRPGAGRAPPALAGEGGRRGERGRGAALHHRRGLLRVRQRRARLLLLRRHHPARHAAGAGADEPLAAVRAGRVGAGNGPARDAAGHARLPARFPLMHPTRRTTAMPRLLSLSCALLLALPTLTANAQDALRPEVAAAAQRLQGRVVEWRRDIHQHPELGNREVRTAALVAEHLRALGLEPKTGIATTGVAAVLKGGKPGPRIALRADMDALPVTERVDVPFASKVTTTYRGETVGVMHACGHDAHVAILMGVAEALVAMKDELPGEVLFIFQPAEEGAPEGEKGGAEEMLAQGLFRDFRPDAVFGLHVSSSLNVGRLAVRPGPLMAAADE